MPIYGFLHKRKTVRFVNWSCFQKKFFSSFATKAALTHQGTDSTRPLKLRCSIWHQDVSNRYFKCYGKV